MLHWSYTPEQKEEVKKALAAGVPKATILTYFYPEVTEMCIRDRDKLNKAKEQMPQDLEYVKSLVAQMDEVVAKINHQKDVYKRQT